MRRSAVVVVVAVCAGVIVAAVLLVRAHSGPQTLSEKLGALMLEEAHHSCLNGEPTRRRLTAAERPDLYPDLLPRVRSAEMVSCEDGGEVSTVLHFKDPAALRSAFRRSRSVHESRWCLVGSSAFDGGYLDHPWSLRRYCSELHGTVRPGPYFVSQTGS